MLHILQITRGIELSVVDPVLSVMFFKAPTFLSVGAE